MVKRKTSRKKIHIYIYIYTQQKHTHVYDYIFIFQDIMASRPLVTVVGATGAQGGAVVRSLLATDKYKV